MSVHCSLDEFPRCADWKHLVAGFSAPGCPIKVSLPCVGVYGSKACFSNVGAACQPVNIYDIEEGYADFLKHVTDGAELNLGEQRGDILNIDFTKLEHSHIGVGASLGSRGEQQTSLSQGAADYHLPRPVWAPCIYYRDWPWSMCRMA